MAPHVIGRFELWLISTRFRFFNTKGMRRGSCASRPWQRSAIRLAVPPGTLAAMPPEHRA